MTPFARNRGGAATVESARPRRRIPLDPIEVERRILAGLEDKPQTAGEMSWRSLKGQVTAAQRDPILARLVAEGRIETTNESQGPNRPVLTVFQLATAKPKRRRA